MCAYVKHCEARHYNALTKLIRRFFAAWLTPIWKWNAVRANVFGLLKSDDRTERLAVRLGQHTTRRSWTGNSGLIGHHHWQNHRHSAIRVVDYTVRDWLRVWLPLGLELGREILRQVSQCILDFFDRLLGPGNFRKG